MNQTNQTRAQLTYIGQMLWLISAQLDALRGGSDYPIPDAVSALGEAVGQVPAWPDRNALLERLKGGARHAP